MSYESIPVESFPTSVLASHTELSSVALGGHVVSVSDEFFAEAFHLLEVGPPPSLKGQFGPNGALYSGWESRRHNPAHDWCIIKLGAPSGYIVGFDIDTTHFSGNEGPAASVEGCFVAPGDVPPRWDEEKWSTLLPAVPLGPSSRHLFTIPQTQQPYTHVKLSMYPDGGIARFRVYGLVSPIFPADPQAQLDLAHVLSGGRVVKVSDQHFGTGSNLILPGRGKDMEDGWETRRSRTPGHIDWATIRLGAPGYLEQVEIDTIHFIGNFPESVQLQGLLSDEIIPDAESAEWQVILPRTKLGANKKHFFQVESQPGQVFSHVKVTMFPDGGIKRIRILGRRAIEQQGTAPAEPLTSAAVHAATMVDPQPTEKTLPSIPATVAVPAADSTSSTSPKILIPAIPLTREAFAPFGDVIQAWSNPLSAPRGIKVTSANQGTAHKYHSLSSTVSSYPEDQVTGPPRVSVFRSTPVEALAKKVPEEVGTFEVKLLERHSHTNQIFVPMGSGKTKSVEGDVLEESGMGYLVVVAKNGEDDKPDLSTLRAFVASSAQGIAYGTAIWHHPMLTLEKPIDFTCVETQTDVAENQLDCEIVQIDPKDGAYPTVKLSEL